MLNVAGLAAIAQQKVGADDAGTRDWLNPVDYLKQVLLVQEWGPSPQRGWNFPAWSLSMEWLAYLIFPLLVLVLFRLRDRLPTRWLCVAWVAVLVPLLWYGTDVHRRRVLHLRVGLDHPDPHRVHRRRDHVPDRRADHRSRPATARGAARHHPVGRPAAARGGGSGRAVQHPGPAVARRGRRPAAQLHLVLVPLLIAWIGALALSQRGPSRWLATERLVVGGYISYSLYMTHTVWYGLWRAGMKEAGITGGMLYALATIGLVVGAVVIAWLMWRWVEEPAREWMRRRVGTRARPVEEPALDAR